MQIEINIPKPAIVIALLLLSGFGAHTLLIGSVSERIVAAPVPVQTVQAEVPRIDPEGDASAEHDAPLHRRLKSSILSDEDGLGGDDRAPEEVLRVAELNVRRTRIEQQILLRREEILRYQLRHLEEDRRALGSDVPEEVEEQFREAARTLTALLRDQKTAEQFLLASFNQIWDAQGRAETLGRGLATQGEIPLLAWPVDPVERLSADFHDASYKRLFGFEHEGIDIPVLPGTLVRAAADGLVTEVKDNGLGANIITIQHDAGLVTMYLHLSPEFLVNEGDRVLAGTPIGYSDGRPGFPGAGFSTGAHHHFAVFLNGAAVDPLEYLVKIANLRTFAY